MNLAELKKLIQEEYGAFLEAEDDSKTDDKPKGGDDKPKGGDDKPKAPKKPSVAVSDKDVDADGEDSEDTLRKIYNMLKDFFEKDDEPKGDAGGAPKPPKAPGGPAGGPPPMMGDAPDALQERFKKLANIIKG
jgi:hypothetical protein